MTARTEEVLHVLGLAAPGDTTTAAARALRDSLTREGVRGRLVAVDVRGTGHDVGALRLEELDRMPVIVHAVDGGEALAPVLAPLRRARPHLVHHGSAPGSDRSVLRTLRDGVAVAAATGPAAREELRRLGFGEPTVLPQRLPAEDLPDEDGAIDAHPHPGPHLLTVGRIAPGRSLEILVDAFAQLLRSGQPSAVLSICGPADDWYLRDLLRRVTRRGLQACEVLEPADEAAVRSRLARCDVFVAIQPAELDPYLWRVATSSAVVAPRAAATAALSASADFVELDATPTCDRLARAMRQAIISAGRPPSDTTSEPAAATALRTLLRVA